ncbi:MAG: hypothetical protein H6861_08450 [Rhodospirillales bacterium]|nr:hypothetical protein [Rhodospirillales bacterium]
MLDQTRRVLTSTEWVNRMLTSHPNEKANMHDVTAALKNFGVVWEELFPAEQARIVQLIIHKIAVQAHRLQTSVFWHHRKAPEISHSCLSCLEARSGQAGEKNGRRERIWSDIEANIPRQGGQKKDARPYILRAFAVVVAGIEKVRTYVKWLCGQNKLKLCLRCNTLI